MRQNTPTTIKTSIGEAVEVLDILLNTHKYLLESGVEIQKRLESHPASKKMGIFRRHRSASLEDTPEMQSKGEKKEALFAPEKRIAKKGKGILSPSYAEATWSQTLKVVGEWQLVEKKMKKRKSKKRKVCCRHNKKKRRHQNAPRPPGQATPPCCFLFLIKKKTRRLSWYL